MTIEVPNTTTAAPSSQPEEGKPRPAVPKTRYNKPVIVKRTPTEHAEPANLESVEKRVSVAEVFAMVFSNP